MAATIELPLLDEIIADFQAFTFKGTANVIHNDVKKIFQASNFNAGDCLLLLTNISGEPETTNEDKTRFRFLAQTKEVLDTDDAAQQQDRYNRLLQVSEVWREYVQQLDHPLYSFNPSGYSLERVQLNDMIFQMYSDNTSESYYLTMVFTIIADVQI